MWEAQAKKTVIRRLISHYGLMSIDYQNGSEETVKLAEAVMREEAPEEAAIVYDANGEVVSEVAE